jgi:hypothetical protein
MTHGRIGGGTRENEAQSSIAKQVTARLDAHFPPLMQGPNLLGQSESTLQKS